MKKADWISVGLAVWLALVFGFCLSLLVDSRFDKKMAESRRQAAERGIPTSLAPAILESALTLFSAELLLESPDSTVVSMTKTEAWSELKNTVSEYARLLEFIEEQDRLQLKQDVRRTLWASRLIQISIIPTLIFVVWGRKKDRNETQKKEEIGGTGASPA